LDLYTGAVSTVIQLHYWFAGWSLSATSKPAAFGAKVFDAVFVCNYRNNVRLCSKRRMRQRESRIESYDRLKRRAVYHGDNQLIIYGGITLQRIFLA